MYTYSEVMKTVQCSHPPHHHNGFLAISQLYIYIYIYIYICNTHRYVCAVCAACMVYVCVYIHVYTVHVYT